jgi:hypothetical protein
LETVSVRIDLDVSDHDFAAAYRQPDRRMNGTSQRAFDSLR